MKIGYKILVLVLIVAGFASCNFLDVVPDERTTDTDTYAGRNNGIDYLYSCYAYLPNPANTPGGLDLLTGDEVITKKSVTGDRKHVIFKEGTAKEQVDALVAALKKDGYDFTVGIPI